MIKKLLTLLLITPLFVSLASAITVHIPKDQGGTTPDVNIHSSQISSDAEAGGEKILKDISFINQWLWTIVGLACFGFVVYNGFRLVAARGQSDVFKKASKGLIGALVGVVICFLSYAAIRVIIGLF